MPARDAIATRSCRWHAGSPDETLLRYNAMLTGVFELLADARAQVGAVDAALAAQRDFWLARLDLDRALVGAPLQRDLP